MVNMSTNYYKFHIISRSALQVEGPSTVKMQCVDGPSIDKMHCVEGLIL